MYRMSQFHQPQESPFVPLAGSGNGSQTCFLHNIDDQNTGCTFPHMYCSIFGSTHQSSSFTDEQWKTFQNQTKFFDQNQAMLYEVLTKDYVENTQQQLDKVFPPGRYLATPLYLPSGIIPPDHPYIEQRRQIVHGGMELCRKHHSFEKTQELFQEFCGGQVPTYELMQRANMVYNDLLMAESVIPDWRVSEQEQSPMSGTSWTGFGVNTAPTATGSGIYTTPATTGFEINATPTATGFGIMPKKRPHPSLWEIIENLKIKKMK